MFVRWQWWGDRKRTVERGYRRGKVASAYAVLVESKRVNGQPRHRHVAYLGSVHGDLGKQDPHYRAWWWSRVKPKLDQLVPHAERAKIEAALAKKVPPPPTAAEVEAHDLAHQRKMQEDHGIGPESPGRAASGCQPAGPEVTSTCMLADHTQTPTGLQRHLGKEVLKRQR